jgi:hypothetical protein
MILRLGICKSTSNQQENKGKPLSLASFQILFPIIIAWAVAALRKTMGTKDAAQTRFLQHNKCTKSTRHFTTSTSAVGPASSFLPWSAPR